MQERRKASIVSSNERYETASALDISPHKCGRKPYFTSKGNRITLGKSDGQTTEADLSQILLEIAKGMGQAIARFDHFKH